MLDIRWLEPRTINEALQMLGEYQEEGKLVAGGTWITLVLGQKLLMPEALISLRQLSDLKEIQYQPEKGLHLGALVTHRMVEQSPVIWQKYPFLAETFGEVANVRIRNQATVGGVLCDADYASDPPAMFAALDATVLVRGKEGERRISARSFIHGHYSTDLSADEIVTGVEVPPLPERTSGCYLKFRTRSHEDRPALGVAVVLTMREDGVCENLSIVVGAVSGTPQYFGDLMADARGEVLSEALIDDLAASYSQRIDPLDDMRASAWYRKEMVRVFVRRGIEQARARLTVNEVDG